MAVHEQRYTAYAGPLAPDWQRFLVITRYTLRQLFANRFFAVAVTLAFVYPIGTLAYVYVVNNLDALKSIGLSLSMESLDAVGAKFFLTFLYVQGMVVAFVLTLFAGPVLVTPDMRNGALPLYFARPISRAEYLLGKAAVLAGLLSAVTWVPGLLIFLLQGAFRGVGWMTDNLRLAVALVAGAWFLIATLTLLALAASAMVRWRPAAMAVIFGAFVLGGAIGHSIEAATGLTVGGYFDLLGMLKSVWEGLFATRIEFEPQLLGAWASAAGLAAFCAVALLVLHRRLRAFEVVR